MEKLITKFVHWKKCIPINGDYRRGKNDKNNFVMSGWEGKTLVKTAEFIIGRNEGWDWFLDKNKTDSLQMENKEEWKLSKDRGTLTQKTKSGTAPGVAFLHHLSNMFTADKIKFFFKGKFKGGKF